MQSTADPLRPDALPALRDDPEALEARFRAAPGAFASALPGALAQRPDHLVLRAWAARLAADGAAAQAESTVAVTEAGPFALPLVGTLGRFAAVTVGLAVLAGTYAKLPALFGIAEDSFYPRHLPFVVLPAFAALLAYRYRPARRPLLGVAGVFAAVWLWQVLRPGAPESDTLILGLLHATVLLGLVAGVAALGRNWRSVEGRTAYLQLVAEVGAVTGLILLGGGALTAITLGLFAAVGVDLAETWFEWAGPYGVAAAPLVALYVVSLRRSEARLAPVLARFFGPLALAVLAVYLPVLLAKGAAPLSDRETLAAFDAMLAGVLVLVVLLASERPAAPRHWTDGVVVALALLALVADAAALVALAGRLAEGLTPNRTALLAANVLGAVHLGGVLVVAARRRTGRPADAALERWTARLLPAYAGWAAVVVFLFPLVFGFDFGFD